MGQERIFSLGKVGGVRERRHVSSRDADRGVAFDVLMDAQRCWDSMMRFREDCERNHRYANGDQWGDMVMVDGVRMSEEEYIRKQGRTPLKNNMIKRLLNNILGVYREQSKEPVCRARDRDEQRLGETMSTLLQYVMQLNQMSEIHARSLEEFLIGGFVVHRKYYGWNGSVGKMDCWTSYVDPKSFFIDTNTRDFRGWDVSLVGEVHDIEFGELCSRYAHSAKDYHRLQEIYRHANDRSWLTHICRHFGYSEPADFDFMMASASGLCRVVEVWRREHRPRWRCHDWNSGEIFKCELGDRDELVDAVNAERVERGTSLGMSAEDIPLIECEWMVDNAWHYYHLTPFGDVLEEGETPYAHGGHPYVWKAYPFINGEIHSYVSNTIDQQRFINRMFIQMDFMQASSAKGVLVVPEESLGSMSVNEIADEWARPNGVIKVKTKNGAPLPQQLTSSGTNAGVSELLSMQMKMFEDISGVHGALQGKQANSGVSGTLYAQQAQNAATSLLDILETYSSFVVAGAYIDVKNIQQFYDAGKVRKIAGKDGALSDSAIERVLNVEYDLSVVESQSTPAYRAVANDALMEMWRNGQITLQQMLEVGDFPFADALLQNMQAAQERTAEAAEAEKRRRPKEAAAARCRLVGAAAQPRHTPPTVGRVDNAPYGT